MSVLRLLAALAAPALAVAQPADWAPNITTTAGWNSNVTNASRTADVIGAWSLQSAAGVARRFALGRNDSLVLGGSLQAEACPRFDGLDRALLGPRLAWRHKFGLGAFAPTLGIELAADAVAARESARAGLAGSVTVAWRQRLDEATRFTVTHEFARHDARAFVFDRTGAETAAELVHDLDEAWSVRGALRYRDGDVLSYATPPRPDLVAVAHVRVPNTTFERPMVVYSLAARTVGTSVGLDRNFGADTALALRYDWRRTDRGPLRYVNHLVSAALARQF